MYSAHILKLANSQGFNLVGVVPVQPAKTFAQYEEWLAYGYYGGMTWLADDVRKNKRRTVQNIMPEAKTVVLLGYSYRTNDLPANIINDPARGIIARYAWAKDYHIVLKQKLVYLLRQLEEQVAHSFKAKIYVDTGPILERDLAHKAGLGFIGNNSTLINSKFGSYVWLCEILLDFVCEPMLNIIKGDCHNCKRCLINCPTNALVKPKVLDARRCISYLTIEHKGIIPKEYCRLMGNRIFGCDICQEVCPWNTLPNQKSKDIPDWLVSTINQQAPYLTDLAQLSDEQFNQCFSGTPIMRAKRSGLLRNVAIALRNWGSADALASLHNLANDSDPIIKEQALALLAKK